MSSVKAITAKMVSELRARTGAGMMECKRALEETGGDAEKAVELLRKKNIAKADRRAGHEAAEGVIESYVHFNNRVGVLVELNCETDFVARNEEFRALARDLALHIASAQPIAVRVEDVPPDVLATERRIFEAQGAEERKPEHVKAKILEGRLQKFYQERVLLEQPFVKDDSKSVGDLVKQVAAKTGENVVVRRFVRFELGGS